MEDFKARLLKISSDPVEFLLHSRTLDQVDKKNPIKFFPADMEYIRLYVKVWLAYNFWLVPKSRRMKMSWINIILHLWLTMFRVGAYTAFVSKKEDDADDMVQRAVFVLENWDYDYIPKELFPTWEDKFCTLEFPQMNSKIQGFPSGADQLRQFTFTAIFADEMAFWANAEEMYSASFPTLQGGGRFTGISSPAPGFFKLLVHDTVDKGTSHQQDDVLYG